MNRFQSQQCVLCCVVMYVWEVVGLLWLSDGSILRSARPRCLSCHYSSASRYNLLRITGAKLNMSVGRVGDVWDFERFFLAGGIFSIGLSEGLWARLDFHTCVWWKRAARELERERRKEARRRRQSVSQSVRREAFVFSAPVLFNVCSFILRWPHGSRSRRWSGHQCW